MALSPEIALGVRPPVLQPLQIQSPLDRYQKILTLRGMMEQQQLRGLQVQQAEEELAQARQEAEGVAEFRRRQSAGEKLTPSQSLGILGPKTGAAYLKSQAELAAEEAKRQRTQEDRAEHYLRLIGQAGLASKNQQDRDFRIKTLVSAGAISQDIASDMLAQPFDLEQTQAFGQQMMSMADQLKERREAAERAFKEKMEPLQVREATAKAKTAEQTAEGTQPITKQQQAQAEQQLWTDPGGLIAIMNDPNRSPADKLRAKRGLEQHEALKRAGAAASQIADSDALADTVIANPSLWDRLTPSAATRIAPILQRKGYTDFGRPMNESALTKLSETRSAIESLRDLRQTLKDNEQYIGPISGFQAVNPYSEARQAQAKIDLVRQRVGKALEGGVLRKEDEEKYKRILATLRDTPATAIAKVDSLIETLQRDIGIFEAEQRRGGRNVRPEAKTAPTASGPPTINTKEEYDKLPSGAQYVDAQDGRTYTKR